MLYALLGVVGVVIGLLGSGGSILTVPVLVYIAGVPGKQAIAESLAIVGVIAVAGVALYARQGLVAWRRVASFGGPGLLGTYVGARLAAHVPAALQLTLFGAVMLGAAVAMLRPPPPEDAPARAPRSIPLVALLGAAVGVLTGLVGVGGGFMIVPALVLLVGLSMRQAVGTSLAIIVLNSVVGFAQHAHTLLAQGGALNGRRIALFAAIGVGGTLLGARLNQRVNQAQLRRVFALFLVAMGGFILVREGPRAVAPAPPAAASSTASPSTPMFGRLLSLLTGTASSASDAFVSRAPATPVLDVRTPSEFAGGHVKGAVNVDVMASDFAQRVQALKLPKDGPVYLYCRSGARSARATQQLKAMGYSGAVNVGGYEALRRAEAAAGR